MKKRLYTGFTLIELMVVITIIMVLSAVGFASYSGAQVRARNTKRIGDMKAVQTMYEQYFTENQAYAACSTMLGTHPTAPNASYAYSFSCTTTSYCACAAMEGTVGNSTASSSDASGCTATFTSSGGSYFCVESQQ